MSTQNQILLVTLLILHSVGFPLFADDEKVTGLTVTHVSFNKGSYELVGDNNWVEKGLKGSVRFQFKEMLRDTAAVYLRDDKRNMNIILNLEKKRVMVSSGNTPARSAQNLYVITAARAENIAKLNQLAKSGDSVAQTIPYRAATNKDLIGAWKQIDVRSRTIDDLSDSWYSGLQYFEFVEDGYLKNIILSGAKPELDEDAKTTWRLAPKTTKYLFLNANGLIKVSYVEGRTDLILCTYYSESLAIPKDVKNPEQFPQKGDITLTYYYPKSQKPAFFRLLRRIEL